MIDPQDIADELIAAEREHKAIGQFSDNYSDFDLETAYRSQRAFVQSKLDAGERFVGYKLGLTTGTSSWRWAWTPPCTAG